MNTGFDLFVQRWAWLFLLTFLLHILEEYFGGFHQWIARLINAELLPLQFLELNVFFWSVMAIGIAAAMTIPAYRWLAATFAAMVTLNGVLHLAGSIITMSYSPGVVTGTILWLPLGGYVLFLAYRDMKRTQFILCTALGIVGHLAVIMFAFNTARVR